ncbi:Uncharacterized conserved protein YqhQ [Terribacillus halophilus]|uniref:Uncharacterized conserved protein YqhQ n=1 Tax=Terribacillus halophilus TaxID=361279 RepID=A0A1G6VKS1_9BACI|nr:DUF1385 domain-containing protein [Terribacillus halophilus]SDD54202.1 Uncharacterized conserved protein YqhQ [Terribacillus halophilus]
MSDKQTNTYGGQAVVEGVMFAGKNSFVTAVRRNDDSIDYLTVERKDNPKLSKLKKIPILRGLAAIIQASANGTKHLNFSSERYGVNPEDDAEIVPEEKKSKLAMIIGIGAVGVLSFIFGKLIFTLTPALVADFFDKWLPSRFEQVALEGFLKLILLLAYVYLVSLTPIIKRVFQYHGAEHKVINCYENGLPLTVENVQKQSRLHYRCGSSFMLFTVIVGVIVYMFVATDPLWWRMVNRILLLPVVIGLSFEVLQLTNKVRNIPVLRFLGYPGLWLQLITTKEPKDDQVEVALASFKKVLENDSVQVNSGIKIVR